MTNDTDRSTIDRATDITPAWVQSILRANGVDVTVRGVEVRPVGTGQMGATFRIALDAAGDDVPRRLIVKLPADPDGNDPHAAMGNRCEVGFYRDIADRVAIATPRCYLAAIEDGGARMTIVLADAAPAEQGDQIAGCTVGEATTAAVNLAGLHAPTWCDPAIESYDWVVSGRTDLDGAALLAALVDDATPRFIEQLRPADDVSSALRRFAEVSAQWASGRQTPFALCHGDYRLDNLLFAPPTRPDDPVVAIDWGVVSVGVPQRDVALLVAAGLDPDERRNGERAVLGAYHRRLVELGVTDYDADANWDDYRHSLLYPLMVVVLGWAHSQRSERGDDMFQVMAARSASAIADHDPFSVL